MSTERKNLLLYELDHTFEIDDWYSPLNLALDGITAEQAILKPTPQEGINSIWELTAHMLYYKERLLLRLNGERPEYASDNRETFLIQGDTQDDWGSIVRKTHEVSAELRQKIESLSENEWDEDAKMPVWQHINGVIRHEAHHTGQIVLIRKLLGFWSETTR